MNRIALIMLTLTIILSTQCKKKTTTPANSCTEITDSRDGQKYKVVKIGEQCWMAENLNFETASDSYCYNDDPANCDEHGRLYEWDIAQTACPDGWHLPSKAEVEILIAELGGEKVAGKELKEGGSSGFNFKLSGDKDNSTGYGHKSSWGSIWTSSSKNAYGRYSVNVNKNSNEANINTGHKNAAYSCRCLKD
jgi:uncharacterized protein (TIGR02145 family)